MQSRRIHFVGIGGIGMSGLAGILQSQGKILSGSDSEASATTDVLKKSGIKLCIGHAKKNLESKTDLVVYSLAIPHSNPELKEALRRKIKIISYPEAVGELSRRYFTIAVCGTHGKSTITAMVSKILIENNFDPTVIVGTKLKELAGCNFRVGRSRILVLEACEYQRAFLNYFPRMILLHTLDPDHLDYFRDFNDYLNAFRSFVLRLPPEGYFFGNLDDEDVHKVMQTLQTKKFPAYNMFNYSTRYPSSDFYLSDGKIVQKNARVGELKLKIPGQHNKTNALASFSVCSSLGISPDAILRSLNHYEGAFRRFEIKGRIGKTVVIDDYGHHPVEIEATLQASREQFPKGRICVVFQPHQYSRTKKLLKEFGKSFKQADLVIIPNIYAARDTQRDIRSVSAQRLVEEILKNHTRARYGEGMDGALEYLKTHAEKFDVVITMGAGDVWKIGEKLLKSK